MSTITVRISRRSRDVLRNLATGDGESIMQTLDKAVEVYRRERFLKAANAELAALKEDRRGWKQYSSERETWERTLGDGLEAD